MFNALELFNASLQHKRCLDPEIEFRDFIRGLCFAKFAFYHLLSTELAAACATNNELGSASRIVTAAENNFQMMRTLPYFARFGWTQRAHIALNHELYPNYYGPLWPNSQVPLASFLEEHHHDFRADLDLIMSDNNLFDRLRERDAGEDLSVWPPGTRKHIKLADMREEEKWKGQICRFAKRTCALLQQRPEVTECPRAAVMIARLDSGAWLKPHYGKSRRLVAHLGLSTPPGPITLNVGPTRGIKWQEGKAFIFDDTFVHDTRHEGEPGTERYILHIMLCHPCEQLHNYPHLPSDACTFGDPVRADFSQALRVEVYQ